MNNLSNLCLEISLLFVPLSPLDKVIKDMNQNIKIQETIKARGMDYFDNHYLDDKISRLPLPDGVIILQVPKSPNERYRLPLPSLTIMPEYKK